MRRLWKSLPREDRWAYALVLVSLVYFAAHVIVALLRGTLTDGV